MREPVWTIQLLAGVMGLIIGSFLNVVISRVPAKESLIRPPSHCPNCSHPLGTLELIPVLSWIALRARCKQCHKSISARYPITEALTAALWVFVVIRFGPNLQSLAWCILTAALIALFQIDIATRKLPSVIVWGAGIPAMAISTAAIAINGHYTRIWHAALAAAIIWIVFFLLFYTTKGFGFGDVRLILVLGYMVALLGPTQIIVAVAVSFGLATVYGITLIIAFHKNRKTAIPLGPFLAVGFLATGLYLAPGLS